MLTLTINASSVIRALETPDSGGLRITSTEATSDYDDLAITPAATPRREDQVVEEQGARVFLDPNAADLLDDMVLDASVGPDGNIQFLLAHQ